MWHPKGVSPCSYRWDGNPQKKRNQTNKGVQMMNLKDTASILVEGNKTALKANASRRAGVMFNQRVANIVTPRLPMMARGYAQEPWFKFVLANAVAGALIKFGASNDKLMMLADAGVVAANDEFLGSFDLEGMVDDLIDGIDVTGLTKASDTVRGGAATVLRKAADVTDASASA